MVKVVLSFALALTITFSSFSFGFPQAITPLKNADILRTVKVSPSEQIIEGVLSFAVAATQSAGNPNVRVWVNTNSGVYHCPGTRWYGNTKQGQYMSQKEAQAKGYRPAYGSVCG